MRDIDKEVSAVYNNCLIYCGRIFCSLIIDYANFFDMVVDNHKQTAFFDRIIDLVCRLVWTLFVLMFPVFFSSPMTFGTTAKFYFL